MDFSKRGVIKKQRQVKTVTKKLVSKARVSTFRIGIVLIVFLAVCGSLAGFGMVKGLIDSAPAIDTINVVPTAYKSYIYDSEGNLVQQLAGPEANREYVTIDQIPKVVQYCFVALEDERFYEHDGIDVRGIARAAYSVLKEGDLGYGGSTLTQQLLKNQVFGGGAESNPIRKISRKIQEQYLAIQLENELSKDQIMEYYLNTINLGNGAWGIQSAAKTYFQKDVWELTLSEAAVIAPIANSPTLKNPVKYPEKNAESRKSTLENMLDQGLCTKEEYDEAIADNVYERIQLVNEEREKEYYSYFTDAVIEEVLDDLVEIGYTQTEANNLLYSGGISIYTTQDPQIQQICDEVFADESNFPAVGEGSHYELEYALSLVKEDNSARHFHLSDVQEYFKEIGFKDPDGKYVHDGSYYFSEYGYDKEDMLAKLAEFRQYIEENVAEEGEQVLESINITLQPQTSLTIIDQYTGHVVALVGGRGGKTGNRTLNRATGTLRQVGSTFKVLASFLPALDAGGLTLASVQDDAQYFYPGTEKEVTNWEEGVYEGLTSIRRGIYRSKNIVAVKTLEQIGPQLGFDYLKKLGFKNLVEKKVTESGQVYSDIQLPLALGGLTNGVSNLEMTAAYAAIANGGVYTEPVLYTKVVDHDGNILLDNTDPKRSTAMKSSTAYLLTSAMMDTITRGTGSRLKFTEYKMPVAGKTGTTSGANGTTDVWFAGYTPYYTAAIWSGYDHNKGQTNKSYHQYIWRQIMERIHSEKQLEYKEFTKPESIVSATICTKCGNLAVEGLCDQALGGSTVMEEIFAKGTVPTQKCTCHVAKTVCKESGKFATAYCPETEQVVYLVKTETSPTKDTPNILPSSTKVTILEDGTEQVEEVIVDCQLHTLPESLWPEDEENVGLEDEEWLPEEDDEGESGFWEDDESLWEEP
ncbi:MAG: transglycosylase domain-containing protein [Lachnospiraceae bacterium]|nr:transglycosylase domain-containing protein [Lachnospiraceae bacterium]